MSTIEVDDCAAAHTYRGTPYHQPLTAAPDLFAALADRVRADPALPYLTAVAPDGSSATTITYGELDARIAGLVRWLRHDLSAEPGDVIGLLPANDIPSAVAIFAILRAGLVCLLLSPNDPAARLREQADALKPRAVLRSPALTGADHVAVADPLPDAPLTAPGTPEPAGPAPMSDALLFGTSGSTAASKVVVQTHRNLVTNAEAVRRHHRLRRGDRLLGSLPIYHANAVHLTLFAPVFVGGHAILAQSFDPFGYSRLVQRLRPRIASVVPSLLEVLLEMWRAPELPPEFEYFVSAAAPLAATTARRVERQFGVRVFQGYGLTETTNFSTTMPVDLPDEAYRRFALDCDIPSIGVALFGNEVAVLGADGERLPRGEVGEICVRGHNVMARYVSDAQATAEAFRGGWFHSQDLGFEVDDPQSGRTFVVVTGRTKNMAKVCGEAVSLDEMERVIRRIRGVRDAVCFTVANRLMGEEIVAAVVFDDATGPAIDVAGHLRTTFSATATPRRIVPVDAVPRTATGKVRRANLSAELHLAGDPPQPY